MKCTQGTPASLPAAIRSYQPSHLEACHRRRRPQPHELSRFARADAACDASESAERAAATVNDCLRSAAEGRVDALLEHVPDEVLDRCIALQKSVRYVETAMHIYTGGSRVCAQ